MAQSKTISWTNPAAAVARNMDCGFEVSECTSTDITNGKSYYWVNGMGDGYYQTVDTGAVTTSNGFTPLAQSAVYGCAISAFTNANPGVITAANIAAVGVAIGDTITVSDLADDGSATSLNGTFTVASVTATAITLVENTSAYSVWVSGGIVKRVTDVNGDAVPRENFAIQGMTLGTGCVGANNAVMIAVFKSDNPVD